MTETMLVGIDGSEGARRAAEFALDRAKASGSRLVVAFVIDWSPYQFLTPEELEARPTQYKMELERAQTMILDPLVNALDADGIELETRVRHGHVADVLVEFARELGASQIFIGRHGHARGLRHFFGSVVNSLVQASPVPITVVP